MFSSIVRRTGWRTSTLDRVFTLLKVLTALPFQRDGRKYWRVQLFFTRTCNFCGRNGSPQIWGVVLMSLTTSSCWEAVGSLSGKTGKVRWFLFLLLQVAEEVVAKEIKNLNLKFSEHSVALRAIAGKFPVETYRLFQRLCVADFKVFRFDK